MKRELKVKELQLLDAARARFLKHTHDQRSSQLHRLDHDIQRKMDLRDQETAAAVQDLEVRQMELEAQRKLLEQRLAREQERVSEEVRVEVDTRTRRAELEAAAQQQRLLSLDDDTELGPPTRRVLEESLAEAAQLGADSAWQGQVMQRLRWAEEEQGRRYERLAGLHREARAREEELLHTLREKEGRKWEEVVSLQGQLQQDRLTGCIAEAQRTQQLSQDRLETQQHPDNLHRSQQHTLDGQSDRKAMSPCPTRGLPPRPATAAAAFTSAPGPSSVQIDGSPVCLNNQSASDVSTSFSLDRGREQLDTREREMMRDILELRLKLAARAKRTLSCASLSSISQ